MRFARRLLSEPLVQFLMIGSVVFGAWSVLDRSPRETAPQVIEIGPGRIAQIFEGFTRTWQRHPTPQELNGLIEAFVKEEIFYREGTKMGLDRDDTIFRRRMQQKMEFLMEPGEGELNASEEELRAFLEENAEAFHVPARVAFRQIYFDPARRGDTIEPDMAQLLAAIEADESDVVPVNAGDPTLLPTSMPLMRTDQIASNFGADFAEALSTAAVGRWTGPLESGFGRHLVFVDERMPARNPGLNEVRDVVLREWQAARRRAISEERYRELRENYDIIVILPSEETTPTIKAGGG